MNSYSFLLNSLPITPEQLNLVLLAVGGFFLFFSIFWGMIRGFKKTTFRGLWLVFTILVLFLITPIVTNAVVNINISSLGLKLEGQTITSVSHAIAVFAESQGYSQILIDNPVVAESLIKIPLMLINSIIFVILFWVLKAVLYPIWAIISSNIFKKKNEDGTKVKKQRLLGMLVGAVVGLLIGSVTLMPVMNYTKLIAQVEAETINPESADEGGLLTLVLADSENNDILVYINSVNNSTLNNIYKAVGLETLNSAIFDGLSKTNINNSTIKLNEEAVNIAKVVKLALGLENINTDLQTLTKDELAKLLNTGQELIDTVFKVKTLNALGDSLLPYFANNIANNQDFIITLPENENPHIHKLMKESVETFENYNFSNLKHDLQSFVSAIQTLNNADIIIPIIHADTSDLESIQTFTKSIDNSAIVSAVNKLFGMKSIASISPIAINTAITLGYEQLQAGQTIELKYDNISVDHLQNIFSELVKTALEIFNELDFSSDFYIGSPEPVAKIGKIVDLIESYEGVPPSEYEKLINSAIDTIKEQTSALSEFASQDLINSINNVVDNLANINSFEAEVFIPISLVLEDVLSIYELSKTSENIIQDIDLAVVGNILDNVKTISIIAPEFESIIISALDMILDMFELPAEFGGFATVLTSTVQQNIKPTIVWKTELPIFKDFVEFGMALDFDALLTQNGLQEFGMALDTLSDSALIGNSLNIIVEEVLNIATDLLPSEELDLVGSTLNQIKTNLTSVDEHVLWETEMLAIGKLLTLAENTDEVSQVGALLDEIIALDSQLINRTLINNLVVTLLESAAEDMAEFEEIFDIVAQNIEFVDNFETELDSLFTFINDLETALENEINLPALGAELDSYNNSVLVGPVRVKIVEMIFDEVLTELTDPDVIAEFEDIRLSLVNELENETITYETALTELDTLLQTLEDLFPEIENNSQDANVLGTMLNTLKDLSIFGETKTANIVITIADDLIEQVEQERDDYIAIFGGTPLFDQDVVDDLNDIIAELESKIVELESVETTPIDNYITFLQDMYDIAEV